MFLDWNKMAKDKWLLSEISVLEEWVSISPLPIQRLIQSNMIVAVTKSTELSDRSRRFSVKNTHLLPSGYGRNIAPINMYFSSTFPQNTELSL